MNRGEMKFLAYGASLSARSVGVDLHLVSFIEVFEIKHLRIMLRLTLKHCFSKLYIFTTLIQLTLED
jgi:hypothetical protein